jgi:hypothetical protein
VCRKWSSSDRLSRAIQAGPIWTNTYFQLNDGFAGGGFKQGGVGRLRGPLAIAAWHNGKATTATVRSIGGTVTELRAGTFRKTIARKPGESVTVRTS